MSGGKASRVWTDAEIGTLIRMADSGHTAAQIAREIGPSVSYCHVGAKAKALGLSLTLAQAAKHKQQRLAPAVPDIADADGFEARFRAEVARRRADPRSRAAFDKVDRAWHRMQATGKDRFR